MSEDDCQAERPAQTLRDRPLQSTEWVRLDRSSVRRRHATPADFEGELDWDAATRLAWRPAWAIRSRRGAWAPFAEMLAGLVKRRQ